MDKLFAKLPLNQYPHIVMGDFNIDLLQEKDSNEILHFMTEYGFKQLITKTPTHREGGLLDHMYINSLVRVLEHGTICACYTDHVATYMKIVLGIWFAMFYSWSCAVLVHWLLGIMNGVANVLLSNFFLILPKVQFCLISH